MLNNGFLQDISMIHFCALKNNTHLLFKYNGNLATFIRIHTRQKVNSQIKKMFANYHDLVAYTTNGNAAGGIFKFSLRGHSALRSGLPLHSSPRDYSGEFSDSTGLRPMEIPQSCNIDSRIRLIRVYYVKILMYSMNPVPIT